MRLCPALGACTLFLYSLLALGQQAPAPQPPSSGIMGTVVDAQRDSIPSASVTLTGPNPADHSEIQTDEDGFFTFRNLRPEVPYHLTIAAKGFANWASPEIVLKPGDQRDLGDIALTIAVVQTTVTARTTEEIATQEVHVEEQQRVIGIFPNFYVTYDPHPVPLTSKLKYQLALRSSIDPVNFLGTAAFAGFDQAGDTPDYPEGAKGYAERFGAGYADGFSDIMIGGAILPSLLHQDPRYFYKGTGSVKSRFGHAAAFAAFCKGDNGHWQFNYSSVGGDLISGAISNLYYPPSNRGPGLVFINALLSAGGRVADDLAQEFVFRHWTPSAKKQPAPE
jgi:Carboxypeptidase regulatory-like domain